MFKEKLITLLIVVFLSNCVEFSNAGCSYGWKGYKQLCYKKFQNNRQITWPSAQANCRRQGGDLAVIPDAATNKIVSDVSNGHRSWIGASRIGGGKHYGQFAWVDGRTIGYHNFESFGFDNYGGIEFCVTINWNNNNNGKWNDYNCWNSNPHYLVKNYVCQRPSN